MSATQQPGTHCFIYADGHVEWHAVPAPATPPSSREHRPNQAPEAHTLDLDGDGRADFELVSYDRVDGVCTYREVQT